MHSNANDSQLPAEPGRFGPWQPKGADGHARTGRPVLRGSQERAEGAGSSPVANGPWGTGGGSIGAGGGGRSGGRGGGGNGEGGGYGAGDDGGEAEQALRRMLHERVRGIEPSPDSLAYLRHAVPARRAHRRRALAGAAAAVVLVGVGVPALVTTGLMPGPWSDHSVNAGDSHDQAQHSGGAGGGGQSQRTGSAAGGGAGSDGRSGGRDGSAEPSPRDKASAGADPNETLATSAPSCGRQQLGSGSAVTADPLSDGTVYGSFRVVNTSSDACTVDGEGVVGVAAHGHADIDRISVVDHTSGDPAGRLPGPDVSPSELVLKPGDAYLVKFAWVPSECKGGTKPKSAEGNGPEGSQGGNNGNSGGTGTPDTGGQNGEHGGDSGGDQDKGSSVVLTHTPDVGEPAAANTELDGACAGTLYRTGVLAE